MYTWLLFLNAIRAHDSFIFQATCTDVPTYCGSRTTHCTLTCMLIRDFKMQPSFCTSVQRTFIDQAPTLKRTRVMQCDLRLYLQDNFYSRYRSSSTPRFGVRLEKIYRVNNYYEFSNVNIFTLVFKKIENITP